MSNAKPTFQNNLERNKLSNKKPKLKLLGKNLIRADHQAVVEVGVALILAIKAHVGAETITLLAVESREVVVRARKVATIKDSFKIIPINCLNNQNDVINLINLH